MELNKNGVNKKIKAHIFDQETMNGFGFTDYNKSRWYYCKVLDERGYISFNVTINKHNIEDLEISVLDEDFCQPYDYQYLLEKNPNFEFALEIKEKVEAEMERLQGYGVLSGHIRGEYI